MRSIALPARRLHLRRASLFECLCPHAREPDHRVSAFTQITMCCTEDCSSYEQLGLKFRLYSAEILFNQGLTFINLARNGARQQAQMQGMALLDQARKEKQTDEHKIIEEAYAQGGQGFTVFSVPVGVRGSLLYFPTTKIPV